MGLLDFLNTSNKQTEGDANALSLLPQDAYAGNELSLEDVIAPSALKITPKNINLGGKVAKTYFITEYPATLTENWFTPIINLDKVFDISMYIHPIDTAQILKKFQKKVAEVLSQINTRAEKGFIRDPKLDMAYQNLESLRDKLQQAQEKVFDVGIYISLYADTEDELKNIESEVRTLLESKMVYSRPALFQQEEGFKTIIPINNDELLVHRKLNTAPLSSFFPFVSFDLTSNKGILYGVNRQNASLILFDRYSLPNYNSLTFATSGSGKSYTTKLEVLRSLMFDTDVIVIDPENEYQFLAQSTGGRFVNISLTSEHHINPFDLPVPREDEAAGDVLRSQIISLVGLFRIMLGGLSPEEDAIIDRALSETYALKDITDESDFSTIEPPLLSDFELVLSGMEGAEGLVQKLTKYTRGTWSGFLNQPTNIDIDNHFIVFSIRDMEDELKPIAMFIVTHFIWGAVRKNLRKRLMVVDEAWWMMKSEDTASFLFALAKRGRKYFLGISTITQDVNDFLKSPYGMPIMTNSSMQLLLKQSATSIDLIQETFNLTQEEKYLLLESNVGEGIFIAGLKRVAIKVIASYTEDQIITSDPSQLLAIKKAKEELAAAEGENQ